MDSPIDTALSNDRLIDITTVGRKSGIPQRIEIAIHNFDGELYISGRPGKRDWFANLLARPQFTVHLKQSTQADLPATATPITDPEARRQILTKIVAAWGRQDQLDAFVQASPLIKVQLERPSP